MQMILSYFGNSNKADDLDKEMRNGGYLKYMEVSALKYINVEEIFTAAIIEFLNGDKDEFPATGFCECCCIML